MEHVCIGGTTRNRAGRHALQYVLEAASLKVDQVELYVAVDNPRGTKFYRKFGFESYGVMPRALRVQGADFDALMMVKKFR
jgi:ribosomal protein S18 acetylase RimI-like enzyme